MASQDQSSNPRALAPYVVSYNGSDIRSIMSPRITGRGELRGVLVPKTGNMKGGAMEGATKSNRVQEMLQAPGYVESMGARRRVTPNTHAVVSEEATYNQANGRIVPSSDGVHRDFAGGFAHGRFV